MRFGLVVGVTLNQALLISSNVVHARASADVSHHSCDGLMPMSDLQVHVLHLGNLERQDAAL